MAHADYDIFCSNPECGGFVAKGYQIDRFGAHQNFLRIPPLNTLVLGNESAMQLFGLPMMSTQLLCIRCQTLLGELYYHRHVLGTRDNEDPDYLFRIGFDRVLYLLRIKAKCSADQFEDGVLEPLIEGLDEGQLQRHNLLKKRATHYEDDDL